MGDYFADMKMYRRNTSIHFTVVNDEVLMLDINNGKYFALNSTGSFIWKELDKPTDLGKLKIQMNERFEVEVDRFNNQIDEFLKSLLNRGLILEEEKCL